MGAIFNGLVSGFHGAQNAKKYGSLAIIVSLEMIFSLVKWVSDLTRKNEAKMSYFATQFIDLCSIWSDLHLYPSLLPHLGESSFWRWLKARSFDYCLTEVFDMVGFLILGCNFLDRERRVLKNTPSKHKQLCRSLCIVAIMSWPFKSVVLALFQVQTIFRVDL